MTTIPFFREVAAVVRQIDEAVGVKDIIQYFPGKTAHQVHKGLENASFAGLIQRCPQPRGYGATFVNNRVELDLTPKPMVVFALQSRSELELNWFGFGQRPHDSANARTVFTSIGAVTGGSATNPAARRACSRAFQLVEAP